MIGKLVILFIKIYQLFLSRFTPTCIYNPSCSEYAILAIKKYGLKVGWVKFKERFSRCTIENAHLYGSDDFP